MDIHGCDTCGKNGYPVFCSHIENHRDCTSWVPITPEQLKQQEINDKTYRKAEIYRKAHAHTMKNKMFFNVYSHNWGVIIPGPTGTVWEQQTDGISCHHKLLEGTFVPFRKPHISLPNPKWKKRDEHSKDLAEHWKRGLSKHLQTVVTEKLMPLHGRTRKLGRSKWEIYKTNPYWLTVDLLDVLRTLNYESENTPTGLKASHIWKLIDNEMKWEYEDVNPPEEFDPYRYYENFDSPWPPGLPIKEELYLRGPDNEEGWKWIKLLKFKSGWGHGPEVKQLEGKILVLIYPNSD